MRSFLAGIAGAVISQESISNRNHHAKESRGDGGGILASALVLAVEEVFEFFLQIGVLAVFFGGVEGVHRGAVIFSECIHKGGGGSGIVEVKRVVGEGDFLGLNAEAAVNRSIALLSTPQVIGLMKPSGGGWCVGRN